jgi:hypothetical protein
MREKQHTIIGILTRFFSYEILSTTTFFSILAGVVLVFNLYGLSWLERLAADEPNPQIRAENQLLRETRRIMHEGVKDAAAN